MGPTLEPRRVPAHTSRSGMPGNPSVRLADPTLAPEDISPNQNIHSPQLQQDPSFRETSRTEPITTPYTPPRHPPSHPKMRKTTWSRMICGNTKAFKHVCHMIWLDLLFIIVLFSATFAIIMAAPMYKQGERLFPVWAVKDADTGDWRWRGLLELSYPVYVEHDEVIDSRKVLGDEFPGQNLPGFIVEIVPLSVALPVVCGLVLLLMQVFVRSCKDKMASLIGLYKSLALITFLQVTLKMFIGQFRPTFMAVCQPILKPIFAKHEWPVESDQVWAHVSDCTGWNNGHPTRELIQAMQGFPSGHTSECFCAATYVALYLNGKLKPFSDYHASLWKLIVVTAPVYGAMFVASTLTIDHNHRVGDILLSIPLGVIIAMMCYRAHYASLFDYRINHLYLPFSSSHRSLDPKPQRSIDGLASDYRNGRLRWQDNLAAVAWPRKAVTHDFYVGQERDNAPNVGGGGYDGTNDDNGDDGSDGVSRAAFTPVERPLFVERAGAMIRRAWWKRKAGGKDVEDGPAVGNASETSEGDTVRESEGSDGDSRRFRRAVERERERSLQIV